MQLNCWSLRCSWSIACRRCSNYIFILNLTPGFNGLGKDNYKMRREAFKFWDLVRLILETLRYASVHKQVLSLYELEQTHIHRLLHHPYVVLNLKSGILSLVPVDVNSNVKVCTQESACLGASQYVKADVLVEGMLLNVERLMPIRLIHWLVLRHCMDNF